MSNIVVKKNAEREKVGSKELRLIVERDDGSGEIVFTGFIKYG